MSRRSGVADDQGALFERGDRDPGPHEATRVDEIALWCDGGSRGNPGPAAIGAVVSDPSTEPPTVLAEVSECIGTATSNVAEYRALLAGLDAAAPFGARRIVVRADSLLLIQQLRGVYKVKHPNLQPLHRQAREKLGAWTVVELLHVPREQNKAADALVNRALDAMSDGARSHSRRSPRGG